MDIFTKLKYIVLEQIYFDLYFYILEITCKGII